MKKITLVAAAVAASAVALTACSSSGGGDKGGSSPKAAPTTPALQQPAVKFGVTGTFSGNGGAFGNPEPEVKAAAQGAVNAINQRGGIAGHEVQLVACDDQGDPNKSADCGRTFVSQGVVAVVGDQSYFGAKFDPIIQKAGIPRIGPLPLQWEFTATNDFLTQGGAVAEMVGSLKHAKAAGKTSVFIMTQASAGGDAFVQILKMEAGKIGLKVKGDAALPENAADVSSYVQAAKNSGADFALVSMNKQLSFQVFQSSQQLGAKYAVGGPAEVPNKEMWDQLGGSSSILNGSLLASSFPPILDDSPFPSVQQFNKEMDSEAASGDKAADTGRGTTFNTWMGFHVVDEVLKGTTAVPTAASLTKALQDAKDIDLGIGVKWTPSKKGALIPTLSNTSGFFTTMKDGQQVLSNGDSAVDFLSDVSTS
jgi:ABC-type branched-subunit amino acid transport system substrate-binding protein